MSANPFESNVSRRRFGVEQFPQIVILVALVMKRHRIDDVPAVTADNNVGAAFGRAQALDRAHQFHPVVGG